MSLRGRSHLRLYPSRIWRRVVYRAAGTLFETRATMLLNESFRKIRNG